MLSEKQLVAVKPIAGCRGCYYAEQLECPGLVLDDHAKIISKKCCTDNCIYITIDQYDKLKEDESIGGYVNDESTDGSNRIR